MSTKPHIRQLSPGQARRVALHAQGLAGSGPAGPAGRSQIRRMVHRLGLLQIDSVNVLARAHYLPLFARLGDYSTDILDQGVWTSRGAQRWLIETWAHEASMVPMTTEPVLRWRRRDLAEGKWRSARELLNQHPGFIDEVLAVITEYGPISAGEVERLLSAGRGAGGWWGWSNTKVACEYLFAVGATATAHRRSFTRHYDLLERVVPPAIQAIQTPAKHDAQRELVAISAAAHGIGTLADLADYFRLSVAATKSARQQQSEPTAITFFRCWWGMS